MNNYWAMKTYGEWSDIFIQQNIIGIDEEGIDDDYRNYQQNNCPITNPRLERRFKQFCKWLNIGDYVAVGTGQQTHFNLKMIARVISDYEFDASITNGARHFRKIDILRLISDPIPVEKWSQFQRLEFVDSNDFMDTLIYHL